MNDEENKAIVESWVVKGKLNKLIEFWVNGLNLDWRLLHKENDFRKVPLPTYAFAKDRYWIGEERIVKAAPEKDSLVSKTSEPSVIIAGAGLFGICFAYYLIG